MALRSIRKAFTFRSKTDLSSSDVSSATALPVVEIGETTTTTITTQGPASPPIVQDASREVTNNGHSHVHRDAQRDEEMQVLRDMNVALKVQLKEALERIAELQLESLSSSTSSIAANTNTDTNNTAIRAPVPAPAVQVHRCCIDLEPFKSGDMVMRLPCFHVHHSECLLPYLKNQEAPECPECRTPIPVDDLDNLPIWQWEPPTNHSAAAASSSR